MKTRKNPVNVVKPVIENPELLLHIFSYISARDKSSALATVSKSWNKLSSDKHLWQPHLKQNIVTSDNPKQLYLDNIGLRADTFYCVSTKCIKASSEWEGISNHLLQKLLDSVAPNNDGNFFIFRDRDVAINCADKMSRIGHQPTSIYGFYNYPLVLTVKISDVNAVKASQFVVSRNKPDQGVSCFITTGNNIEKKYEIFYRAGISYYNQPEPAFTIALNNKQEFNFEKAVQQLLVDLSGKTYAEKFKILEDKFNTEKSTLPKQVGFFSHMVRKISKQNKHNIQVLKRANYLLLCDMLKDASVNISDKKEALTAARKSSHLINFHTNIRLGETHTRKLLDKFATHAFQQGWLTDKVKRSLTAF